MAVLTAPQRAEVHAEINREADCPGGITKPQLATAFAALDDAWDGVATTLNNAIPVGIRGSITARQKARMIFKLIHKRYEGTA